MNLIEGRDLVIGYGRQPIAAPGSFAIRKGEYICMIGENGAGKTTFLRTMLGLLKLVAGTVVFHGMQKEEIGWVSQQSPAQKDFPASVEEVVLSGFAGRLSHRFFYSSEEKKKAAEYMTLTGCLNCRERSFRQLSGGQRQRAMLARALCAAKEILLMDEPTAGLDPGAQNAFYDVIDELHEKGMTIVMITHDLSCLSKADRVIHFGSDVSFLSKEEYLRSSMNVS
jgi:zinc transport system ATP-binding protein